MNRIAIQSLRKYETLFRDAKDAKAIGEASIRYICIPQACTGIKELTPRAKIIFLLRQPVDRAFSAYQLFQSNWGDPADSFKDAWRDNDRRTAENWFSGRYRERSLYHAQLKVWFDSFPREQIRVYLNEDLRDNPQSLMRDLFTFIGVDPAFRPETNVVHNRSGTIANPALRWAWRRSTGLRARIVPHLPVSMRGRFFRFVARSDTTAPRERLDPATRARFTNEIKDDILRTQDLIGRDLSRWLA